jgi:hypothetical protein
MPPLRAARTRVFKVLLTGFLAKAFFKPLGVFTAQALSEIAFQQAIGTTGTQDFLLSHSHTAWDVILSLFFHTPFTTQDFLLPLTILKSGSVVFPAKRRGLFESMDVFTTKALSEDSIWHLLGSKPLLSHITRTRPRLVNIALSGQCPFFHPSTQLLRCSGEETLRLLESVTWKPPKGLFQVPLLGCVQCQRMSEITGIQSLFPLDVFISNTVGTYWDPSLYLSQCEPAPFFPLYKKDVQSPCRHHKRLLGLQETSRERHYNPTNNYYSQALPLLPFPLHAIGIWVCLLLLCHVPHEA